ncbi:hypothetical protein RND71_033343 [Anisodus tanguticus]|uniref:Uncharacterized protein n=1 Tax=Anisodus tanguticus TaxID=243964 RepID=A0AAE1V359_9SOLA|nr:hypothetical protein RND71_033343 [Anisodus tanguticus]
MKSSTRTRTSRSSFHTFLKPGALAQIRYSKISAKSMLKNAQSQFAIYQHIPFSGSPSSDQLPTMEGLPCFNLKINNNRPCCLHRNKLSAVAPVFCEPNYDPTLVTI